MENFRPGTLENWGLGYESMKKVNPRVILVRISGYGQTGPYRDKAGFGTPAAAFSGITYMQGYPDRPPISPPLALADYVAGTFGAMAALMALYHLKSTRAAGRARRWMLPSTSRSSGCWTTSSPVRLPVTRSGEGGPHRPGSRPRGYLSDAGTASGS